MSFEEDVTIARKHIHQIELPASPERVFEILRTPSAIRQWWQASRAIVIAEEGGAWAAAWGDEDDPDYATAAVIRVFDPPRRLSLTDVKYYARSTHPPFRGETTIDFIIERRPEGSRLRVIQDGFPADPTADEFYAACEAGWQKTFEGIRQFLAGKAAA
ncbi:MAG: SRPBCC domain-containing protein [Acidobacteriota bacterium]